MLKTYIAVKALIKRNDSFLLLKNKDSQTWETPGGKLEDGEEILPALIREVAEETGLDVNILFPFNVYSGSTKPGSEIIGINFISTYKGGKVLLDHNEHSDYIWADIPKIKTLTDSLGLQKEIEAYQNFIERFNQFL